ncbi:hypothetical protein DIURU_000289 [Diutina rugosa]|uniref:TATA-binding protein interacting (TIP20) domain-containing protein n=1 Tax=Diutina rugosa TaxID=5481 RepID=A0A642UYX0_DIURU|nr:uncharacterized protein DIURU_000289 [Diutina rugosa]KAA8908068.1 hypothetical protein DIURU_000289 [Diutina rugosa]
MSLADINFTQLRDGAVDVDPDIRFMALQDFQKYVTSAPFQETQIASKNVATFIPKLYDLIKDPIPDVQSHAVKSVAPLVTFLPIDMVVEVASHLYAMITADRHHQPGPGFTTTVPTMALRGLIQAGAGGKLDAKSARVLADTLLALAEPDAPRSLDAMEVLTDTIRSYGYVLKPSEASRLVQSLIEIAIAGDGGDDTAKLVGRRAVVAVGYLCHYLTDFDAAGASILRQHHRPVQYALLSTLVSSQSATRHLADSSIDVVWAFAKTDLDPVDIDDTDYDQVNDHTHTVERSLELLTQVLGSPACVDLTSVEQEVVGICERFLRYKPFGDDDDDYSDDDDIEFSDDDDIGDDGDEDGSWKVRTKACELLAAAATRFGALGSSVPVPPITDDNEHVSHVAIKTVEALITNGNVNIIPDVVHLTSTRLLEKPGQLGVTLKLVEVVNDADLTHDTVEVFAKSKHPTNSLDVLAFFRFAVDEAKVDRDSMLIILDDLIANLDDKSFNIIGESISVLTSLFDRADGGSIADATRVSKIAANLQEKIANANKKYSSDLIQLAIRCLAVLVSRVSADEWTQPAVDSIVSQLAGETNVVTTLESLFYICDKLSEAQARHVIHQLTGLIISNHETVCTAALRLLYHLLIHGHTHDIDTQAVVQNVLRLVAASHARTVDEELKVLTLLNQYPPEVSAMVIKLINNSSDEKPVADSGYDLVRSMAIADGDFGQFYQQLSERVDKSKFAAARALATVAVAGKLSEPVRAAEAAPTSSVFNLNFLGCAADFGVAVSTKINDLLDSTPQTKDEISAVSYCVGSITKANPQQLPVLVDFYVTSPSSKHRWLAVMALKGPVEVVDPATGKQVFETIVERVASISELGNNVTEELKSSGEVLSEICLRNPEMLTQLLAKFHQRHGDLSLSSVYVMIAIAKQLVTKLDDDAKLAQFLQLVCHYMDVVVNLKVREAAVGTLLTALHNRTAVVISLLTDTVLPVLFNQMVPEESFKKVIQMGPHKYIHDEGVVIRTLTYEFLYSLVSLTSEVKSEVLEEVVKNMVLSGLTDTDVVTNKVACENLIHFIDCHQSEFARVVIGVPSTFSTFMDNLSALLQKNVAKNAHPQDVESFENRIEAIVKLVKKVDQTYNFKEAYPSDVVQAWQRFLSSVKMSKGARYL